MSRTVECALRDHVCLQRRPLHVAPKDDVKAKIGSSPDEADAFALTFAAPVLSRRQQERGRRRRPYSAVNDVGSWWDEPDHA